MNYTVLCRTTLCECFNYCGISLVSAVWHCDALQTHLVGVDGRWRTEHTCSAAVPERTRSQCNPRVTEENTRIIHLAQHLIFKYLQWMYLQWLHLQSDSSRRQDRNSINRAWIAAVWGQRICQVSNHHQFFPSSRSNPKVSSLLCDFQRALQILVKEFTPGNQTLTVFNIRAHTHTSLKLTQKKHHPGSVSYLIGISRE